MLFIQTWGTEKGNIPVELERAFVVDTSGSIDENETYLQRKTHSDALVKLQHPQLFPLKTINLKERSVATMCKGMGPTC